MFDRPSMPSSRARSYRWSLLAFSSTPPAVSRSGPGRLPACGFFAWGSDGPLLCLGTQWSPCFSYWCLTADMATRWARSPSPYSSTALSCASIQVRCAFFGDRRKVSGSSSTPGIVVTSDGCVLVRSRSGFEDRFEDAVLLGLETAVGLRGPLESDVVARKILDAQYVLLVQQGEDLRCPPVDVGLAHP